MSPARVFALIPEKSDKAIIIRRGPAKVVGVFQWDVKTDEITSFQWLKGRVYEYFSDISPRGNYLIYSANKKGDGYTVISRSPWLKALSFWNNVGGWGGGIFLGENKYLLYDGSEAYGKFRSKEFMPSNTGRQLLKNGVYPARLQRRDWSIKSQRKSEIIFNKTIRKDIFFEKIWQRNIGERLKGKGEFSEFHRLVIGSRIIELHTWEWGEWLNDNFVWSENGCLFRASLENGTDIGEPCLIYDFNLSQFEEKIAPY
jgi:hypothetical protein